MRLRDFVKQFGRPYSEVLGIDLESKKSEEIGKWFLASILYSKPIRESSATDTYRVFEGEGVLTASKILETGWDGLVALLDEGGYTRYDFSTAERLLQIFGNLQTMYDGDLNRLHALSADDSDLEKRLKGLGKGIGETTVSIFLRDMRKVWPKARPKPSALVRLAMRRLKIKDLEKFSEEKHMDAVRLESALLRLGKDYIKKGKELKVDLS